MPKHYQVNEIFRSIQGEGHWAGRDAVFVRLQGCPVGCEWCDTKYTWAAGGKRMHVDEIRDEISDLRRPGDIAVITGGEPLLWNLDELLENIPGCGTATQIETSGHSPLKGTHLPTWLTWSPKQRLNYECKITKYIDEIKFVVTPDLTDVEVGKCIDHVMMYGNDDPELSFMPLGDETTKTLLPDMVKKARKLARLFGGKYSTRLQWERGLR